MLTWEAAAKATPAPTSAAVPAAAMPSHCFLITSPVSGVGPVSGIGRWS